MLVEEKTAALQEERMSKNQYWWDSYGPFDPDPDDDNFPNAGQVVRHYRNLKKWSPAQLVGQPAIGLQRDGKGERMKEEKGSTQEHTSDGKTSQREFAAVQQAGRTGTAAGREGQQRAGR